MTKMVEDKSLENLREENKGKLFFISTYGCA